LESLQPIRLYLRGPRECQVPLERAQQLRQMILQQRSCSGGGVFAKRWTQCGSQVSADIRERCALPAELLPHTHRDLRPTVVRDVGQHNVARKQLLQLSQIVPSCGDGAFGIEACVSQIADEGSALAFDLWQATGFQRTLEIHGDVATVRAVTRVNVAHAEDLTEGRRASSGGAKLHQPGATGRAHGKLPAARLDPKHGLHQSKAAMVSAHGIPDQTVPAVHHRA